MDKIIIPNNLITDLNDILIQHDSNLIKKISIEFNIDEKLIIEKCCNVSNLQLKKDVNNLENNNIRREDINDYVKDIDSRDKLKKYKLPKLKLICKEFKLKITGKKEVLIDRIWDYLNSDN